MSEIDARNAAGGDPDGGRTLEFGSGRRAGVASLLQLIRAHPERMPEYLALFATHQQAPSVREWAARHPGAEGEGSGLWCKAGVYVAEYGCRQRRGMGC